MFKKVIEIITGKDDLERVAHKEDIGALNALLETRPVVVPRRPKHFLDLETFTQEKFQEIILKEAQALADAEFEPWVLERDGKRRLPVFSSQKKMEVFSATLSKELRKVFGLGSAEVLVETLKDTLDLDFIDLNPFSEKSWEIAVKASPVAA